MLSRDDLADWYWLSLYQASSSGICAHTPPPLQCPWMVSLERNLFHSKEGFYIGYDAFDRELPAFIQLLGPWQRKFILLVAG